MLYHDSNCVARNTPDFLAVPVGRRARGEKDDASGHLKALIRRIAATTVVHCKPDCGSGHSKIPEENFSARFNEVLKSED